MIAAARLPLRSEPAKASSYDPRPDLVLGPITGQGPVFEIARQRSPAFQAVVQGSADGSARCSR